MEELDSWSESTNFTVSQPPADISSLEGMIRMKMRGGEFTPPRKGRILDDESVPIPTVPTAVTSSAGRLTVQQFNYSNQRGSLQRESKPTYESILNKNFLPKDINEPLHSPLTHNSVDGMRERERVYNMQREDFLSEKTTIAANTSKQDDINKLRRWILTAASTDDNSVDLLQSLQGLNSKQDHYSGSDPENEAIEMMLEKCIRREYENDHQVKGRKSTAVPIESDTSTESSSSSYKKRRRRRGRKSRNRRKSRHSSHRSSSSASSSSSSFVSRRTRRIQREQDKVIERLAMQNAFFHHNQNMQGASQQQHLQLVNNEISQYYNSMRDQQARMLAEVRTLMEEDKKGRETEMRQAITNLKEEAKDIIKDIAKAATPVVHPQPSPLSVPSAAEVFYDKSKLRPKIPISSPILQRNRKSTSMIPIQPKSMSSPASVPSHPPTPTTTPGTSPQVVPSSAAARPPINPTYQKHNNPITIHQSDSSSQLIKSAPQRPEKSPVLIPQTSQPPSPASDPTPAPAASTKSAPKPNKSEKGKPGMLSRLFPRMASKSDKSDKKPDTKPSKSNAKKDVKTKARKKSAESETTESESGGGEDSPVPAKSKSFFGKASGKPSDVKPPDCLAGRYIFQLSESSCLGSMNKLELLMKSATRDDDCYAFTGLSSTAIPAIDVKEMLQHVCENRPLTSDSRKLEKAGAAHMELCKFYNKSGMIQKKLLDKIIKQKGKVKTDSKFEKKYLITTEKKIAFYGIANHLKATFSKEPAQGKHRRLAKNYMEYMCRVGEMPEAKKEYLADFLLGVIKGGERVIPSDFQMPTPVGPAPVVTSMGAADEDTSSDEIQSVSEPTASDPPQESRRPTPSPRVENSSDDEPESEKFVPSGTIDGYRLKKTPHMRAKIMTAD